MSARRVPPPVVAGIHSKKARRKAGKALAAALAESGTGAERLEELAAAVEATGARGHDEKAVAEARRRAAAKRERWNAALLLQAEQLETARAASASADEAGGAGAAADTADAVGSGVTVAGGTCCVCLCEVVTHAFAPCGHKCVCAVCGEGVMDMPNSVCVLCRKPALCCMQIYESTT